MKKEYKVVYDGCLSSIEKVEYLTDEELLTLAEAKSELQKYAENRIRDFRSLKASVSKLRSSHFHS